MQSTVNLNIQQSGQLLSVPNSVNAQSGSTLQVTYAINGAPASLTLTVMGYKNAGGESPVLDTYQGTANTTRTISLSDTYDAFLVLAVWTGGTAVAVSAAITSTGAGLTFSAGAAGKILVGTGSPNGLIAAPLGTLYVSTAGGSGTTLYVKESGGSTNSGWVGK